MVWDGHLGLNLSWWYSGNILLHVLNMVQWDRKNSYRRSCSIVGQPCHHTIDGRIHHRWNSRVHHCWNNRVHHSWNDRVHHHWNGRVHHAGIVEVGMVAVTTEGLAKATTGGRVEAQAVIVADEMEDARVTNNVISFLNFKL